MKKLATRRNTATKKPFKRFVGIDSLSAFSIESARKNLSTALAAALLLDDVKRDTDGYSRRERAQMLAGMRFATSVFYALAVSTHVHAFHEFSGLMGEFADACAEAERRGRRWVHANECAGHPLTFFPHQISYIDEKLRCMFGFGLELPVKGKRKGKR
jgi:hypothetical protein